MKIGRGVLVLSLITATCFVLSAAAAHAPLRHQAAGGVVANPAVSAVMDSVSQDDLWDQVGGISGITPIVVAGAPYTLATRYTYSGKPLTMATQYVYERCAAFGLSPRYQAWGSTRNVECEKTGTTRPDEIVLVTAHIDDMPSSGNAPAADDDGTGVVALLTAARLLATRPLDRTMRFVVFTGEEQDDLGSQAYAQAVEVAKENVVAVFNLEMMGWDGSGQPVCRLYTRKTGDSGYPADRVIADVFVNVVAAYGLSGSLVPVVTASGRTDSDHASFWSHGIPAIVVGEDAEDDFNPYYHTRSDTRDKLNMGYFTAMVKAVVGTAAHLAGVADSDCTPLAAPLDLRATSRSTSTIQLSWLPVTNAAQYRVYRGTASGRYSLAGSATTTSYPDSGLTASTAYYYVVRSVGTPLTCESADSHEASAMTLPPPPPPTATLAATPTSVQLGGSSTLVWATANTTTASINGIGSVPLTGSQSATPSASTTYTITAVGEGGTRTASVTVTVIQPPAAPTGLTAQAQAGPSVRLVWTDKATNETGFVVERCPGVGCTAFAQIASPARKSGTGTVSYTDSTVLANNTYGYRVRALSGAVSSACSNTVAIALPATPAVPTSLACVSRRVSTTDTVTCTWTDNANNETGFQVEYSLSSNFTNATDRTVAANVTTRDTPGLQPNRTYSFRVRATGLVGPSMWSNVGSVTTR